MNAVKKSVTTKVLRNFLPLDKLSIDKLDELLDKSSVEEIPPGRVLFRQGEKDRRNIYLLDGQVELLVTGSTRAEVVKARSVEAKYPLADTLPRPSTCRARTSVTVLTVDTDHLEILMEHDPSGTYEVTELGMDDESSEDNTDWMLRFLQSRAFLQLPTANIQGLLMRLEERPAKRGEIILQQGGQDDFYYIVKQGKCAVSRRPAPKAEDVRLAILSVGDGFGEEALITNGKRNATVIMQEDGVLMRLHKDDFMELLVAPLIKYIDLKTAIARTKQRATLIDVRTNKAFSDNGLEHASNIPLSMLRVKLSTLNPTTDYILYCDNGHQSAAAAFLMIQQGLNCQVIQNGIAGSTTSSAKASPTEKARPTAEVVAIKQEPAKPTAAEKAKTEDQLKFEQHRRQAQEEARKAKVAEEARQAAESKTQQLKSEADKLRLQAERLAMKTANAETARKQAEDEISRIKSDAAGLREQATKDSQKMRQEAEKLRQEAEKELSKIKQESVSIQAQQDAIEKAAREAAQMAAQKSQEAEQAQRQAKAEAERVKAEAEGIRQAAMQEAERLKQEMSQARKNAAKVEAAEAARREAELIAARQRAELAVQQAAQAAEDAKHQAELEARAIRQKAQEEAERTRKAAEAAAQAAAERTEANQRKQQKMLEEARRQAEARLKESAEAAERARREAEQEAEQIRHQALQEAEQLRRDMESTRKLVEEEASKAKARISEDSQRHQRAEAQRRRETAEAESLRQAEEQHRRDVAEAAARQQAEADAARREQQIIREKAEQTRTIAAGKQQDEQHARQLAEEIMSKLAEAEKSRQHEDSSGYQGLHLARATIRRVKDRTILEGDEDIFIFKEPRARDSDGDDDEAFEDSFVTRRPDKPRAKQDNKDDDDLPSFLVEPVETPASETGLMPELHLGTTNYGHSDPQRDNSGHNNRKQLYALAASITIMIGVGIFSFSSESKDPLEALATAKSSTQASKANATAAANIKTDNMASFAGGKSEQTPQVDKEPESKVKKLLSRWKDQLTEQPEE
ncbi:MAG: cyclic nucleotide-binding domain-containing protein [Gammaproteobacteria bacterium]